MTDGLSNRLSGELAVGIDDGVLMLSGDENDIEGFLLAMRGRGIEVAMGADQALAQTVALGLASAVGVRGTSGEFVKLSPESLNLLRKEEWIPSNNGYFHMTVRDVDSKRFSGNLQWTPAEVVGHQALALQTLGTSTALMLAIRDVQTAIAAVEDKVDEVLALAHSQHVGDVIGRYRFLRQTLDTAERKQMLAASSWDSVAAVGADVSVTVERLRSFLFTSVRSLPLGAPADERAKKLSRLVEEGRFSEALGLLVVGQQSLYMWHRLRLINVQQTEPEHLADVIEEAKGILRRNETDDGQLISELYAMLSDYGELKPLEIHRRLSRRRLTQDVGTIRDAFEMFASARNALVSDWPELQDPKVRDAVLALNAGAKTVGRRAQAIGAGAVSSTSVWLGKVAERLQAEEAAEEASRNGGDPGEGAAQGL